MNIQWRLYDPVLFIDTLNQLIPSSIRTVLRAYLKAGAHPFFLEQGMRLRTLSLSVEKRRIIELQTKELLSSAYRIAERVPECTADGIHAPLTRLYDAHGNPHSFRDGGILYGAVVETFVEVQSLFLANRSAATYWNDMRPDAYRQILRHPCAEFGTLATLVHLDHSFQDYLDAREGTVLDNPVAAAVRASETVERGDDDRNGTKTSVVMRSFLRNLLARSIPETIEDLLETWSDAGAIWTWGLFLAILTALPKKADVPATQILETLLNTVARGNTRTAHAARRILENYPRISAPKADIWGSFLAANGTVVFISELVREANTMRTFHAVVRWFKMVPIPVREQLVCHFAFKVKKSGTLAMNSGSEFLIEEIVGPDAWKALGIYQDPAKWQFAQSLRSNVHVWVGMNEHLPEYGRFIAALKKSPLGEHQPDVAESLERALYNSGATIQDATSIFEECINILSGDLIRSVSHLRYEWMPVRRKTNEFLGVELPLIDVALNPAIGDIGAACKFQFTLPNNPELTITGTLGAEGELFIPQAPILAAYSRSIMCAAVSQTLCAVLIPRYIEKLPPSGTPGGGAPIWGASLWAMRPVIHTLGEVGKKNQEQSEPAGTRINLIIAELIFQWLLDEISDFTGCIYERVTECVKGCDETYFRMLGKAKERLIARTMTLSAAYMRSIRAYARPVGVRLGDDGTIIVHRMSGKARRNYERYRVGGGRMLDFSPVRKTYKLPKGQRMILDVPRTFNAGAFNSLEEAYELLIDHSLKQRVARMFRIQ